MRTTRLVRVSLALIFTAALVSPATAQPGLLRKLDPHGRTRASLTGRSRVIISSSDAASLSYLTPFVQWSGGRFKRALPLVNGVAVDLPNEAISALADHPLV